MLLPLSGCFCGARTAPRRRTWSPRRPASRNSVRAWYASCVTAGRTEGEPSSGWSSIGKPAEGQSLKGLLVLTNKEDIGLIANLKPAKLSDRFLRAFSVERLVNLLLFLGATSLVIVASKGGYSFGIGPFQVSEHRLWNPLLFCLALAMMKVWLRAKRMGTPILVRLRSPLLMFLGIVLIYSLNGRATEPGDAIPARYLALSILREFNLDLDEFPFLYQPEVPYFLTRVNGHVVSAYPPWAGVLAFPVYLLPVLGGISPQSQLLLELAKLAATLMTALSAVFLYLALQRITQEKIAWVITMVYAFGTSSFSSSSQALWQHGPSQLFLALALYCLMRGLEEPRFSACAGFALSSAVICRPVDVVMALPVVAYFLLERRAQAIGFCLSALPAALLFTAYNDYGFGSPFTLGIAAFVVTPSSIWDASIVFGTPLRQGLMGILASPGRGLLIYSPILLFSFVGIVMLWRQPGQALFKYLSLAPVILILFTGKWGMWWGGHSYGPRLLADITPILCLYLYLPFERAQGKAFLKYSLAGLSALSIGLHALGAFSDGSWDKYPKDVDHHTERLWSWGNSPPIYYLQKVFTAVSQPFSKPTPTQTRQTLALQAFLSRFYGQVLYRVPDPGELAFWVPFLRAHCNAAGFSTLADNLFESREFWASGPLSPDGLVTILYHTFLRRDPDPVGLAYWANRVRRENLRLALQEFMPSDGFHDLLPDRANRAAVSKVIRRFYAELLGRDPDPAGVAYWTKHVTDTDDLVGPIVGLLGSPEFDKRPLALQQYVPMLYRGFLSRDPDRIGLAFLNERLHADILSMIHLGFIASEEFQGLVPQVCGG